MVQMRNIWCALVYHERVLTASKSDDVLDEGGKGGAPCGHKKVERWWKTKRK